MGREGDERERDRIVDYPEAIEVLRAFIHFTCRAIYKEFIKTRSGNYLETI